MFNRYFESLAKKIVLSLALTLLVVPASAEKYDSLYGFKLGDSLASVKEKLGEPGQIIDIPDGSKLYAYILDNHYVAFASKPQLPDTIFSIQLTGEKNPKGLGLDGINLSDKVKKPLKKFGEPKHRREAIDQKTREKLPGIFINFYGENFSFEETNGKVSSIKITYDGISSSDNPADEKFFETQPPEIKALRDYILNKDYPEVFGDKHYRVAINNMELADLDGDGRIEAAVHMRPHFRQSPTIVIYRFDEKGAVSRVTEGLAPGPPVPLTGNFLDSHTLGEAVDLTAENADEKTTLSMRDMALSQKGFGMIVQYKNFIHADSRQGTAYIDMSHIQSPAKGDTCDNFEFSAVEQIETGFIGNDKKIRYLLATVGDKIYVYRIGQFLENGLMQKTMQVIDRPSDFLFFDTRDEGPIRYISTKRQLTVFALPDSP